MAKAYTYIRCASLDGASESLRRQLELSQKYANENGLELVQTVQDIGVSGYRNRTEGALAGLIEQIESGVVEPGSYLLIESLDRLSREAPLALVKPLISIIGRGVKIVTLHDGQIFDSERLARDGVLPLVGAQVVEQQPYQLFRSRSERVKRPRRKS